MSEWAWVIGGAPPSGVETRQLVTARSRSVTWRVDAPATAQFVVDGRHEEASEFLDLATDLHVYRDGTKLFRGRVVSEQDSVNENVHASQFSAVDYRGMLNYRVIGEAGRTFAATDQAVIAWTLISESQALSGGNWGVTNGVGSTSGTNRDRTYDPGKALGDAISELGRVTNGFEWEITPSLALNRYFPRRGSVLGTVLDYGGVIASVSRARKPSDYANSVLVTGDEALTPTRATSGTIASDPRGRWEDAAGFPSIKEQATLNARATWLLSEASTPRPELSVKLTTDAWTGSSDLWVGDTVTVAVNSGRLAINAAHRVVEVSIALDDEGTEAVTLGMVAA